MDFSYLDIAAFIGFIAFVIGVSLYVSRKEETSEDYFLAGRGLTWWVIGFSLIASNISTEHFVGMAGQGFREVGMAIASWEWIAAFSLIIVALFLLPRFLTTGIYTIPQFLEYRYNKHARLIMACCMLFFYTTVTIAVVLYLGAGALGAIFDISIVNGIWLIGILAGAYTVYGGLKAVVWSDVIQGIALLLGGALATYLGIQAIGGVDVFFETAQGRLHTVLPANHPELPWVAVFIGGMWIPNLFYWGLNQFITQRTLAAKSIDEGQKGVLFGASLKLIIPFIIVFPGIIAYELYGDAIEGPDMAYPYLIKQLLPAGLVGIMFAALFGATMSTLDSLLNSAATIFTIDIYKPYLDKGADNKRLIKVGRIATVVLVILACLWAPQIGGMEEGGLYLFIQQYWGFVQPGLVCAFFMGMLWWKVPAGAAIIGMVMNIPLYLFFLGFDAFIFQENVALFQSWGLYDSSFLMSIKTGVYELLSSYGYTKIAFLHSMMACFIIIALFITVYTLIAPQKERVVYPKREGVEHKTSTTVKVWAFLVFLGTCACYYAFF